jgi:hypothetical protein
MIVIATPTRDSMNAYYTIDLVALIQESSDIEYVVSLGTYLPNLRTSLVDYAVKKEASHILFIDSDMRFPKDSLKRLLSHDLDIVGANCKQRTQNEFTARKEDKFISSKDKTGLEEVDTLGFGVTLIRTSIFDLSEPWFGMPFDGKKYIGEDVFFCHKAKEKGYQVWVDHDLSKEVKHIGAIELGIE